MSERAAPRNDGSGDATEVLLFHHALGLTEGVLTFAERLREAGHRVTTPDLYEGVTFDSLDDGVAHAERIGFEVIVERGVAAAVPLDADVVYAGFSLGAMPAQKLAQTRAGARGLLLYHGGVPAEYFADTWPSGVPLEAHVARHDPLGDVEVLEALSQQASEAELFLYPGTAHLFTDCSAPDYDRGAAELVLSRTLSFLERVER